MKIKCKQSLTDIICPSLIKKSFLAAIRVLPCEGSKGCWVSDIQNGAAQPLQGEGPPSERHREGHAGMKAKNLAWTINSLVHHQTH